MTGFLGRLAIASTVASIPLAAASVATSAVSSAACDPAWARNVWTGECHPQPGVPDWYVVRPAYAPPYAPVDVPPPPPPPPWAQQLQPRWDEGSQQWVWVRI
ncbi:MAG: hypothetical protein QOG73_1811 [Acetobacteraceae bacterium]|jgi:hypothetical protein|nr:hypothetical protein [Acetobacteraceae bacterium]